MWIIIGFYHSQVIVKAEWVSFYILQNYFVAHER